MTWRDIDGWLTDEEGEALASLAAGKIVLEIGSYKGRSAVCMAQTAAGVFAVDHHKGDGGTGPANTEAEFVANVTAAGVAYCVHRCVGPIEQQAAAFRAMRPHHTSPRGTPPFGMAYIDAAHDADSVERHTRIAMALVQPGGLIVWHDWSYGGVQEGVKRCGLAPTGFAGDLAWLTVVGGTGGVKV